MDTAGKRTRRTALVTGASSGIGLELCRLLAADGHNLVLVARGRERLEQLSAGLTAKHGVNCTIIISDLSESGAGSAVFDEVRRHGIDVDILINNAGFATFGVFAGSKLEDEVAMLQVNAVAPTELTRLCLDGMVARRFGRILNVASTAAFQPGPLMAVYYASKAYLLHFSEALADELRGTGVTVTALCPGPTRTAFQARAQMEGSRLFRGGVMDARTVAQSGYAAMMRGRPLVVPGARNKVLAEAIRLLPRAMVPRFVRRAQERDHSR